MTRAAILIVEDEGVVAEDLQQTLIELGYDAFAIAISAEEALRCVATRIPDLALMDIRIRGPRDGIETAVLLRERHGVPVIFLTAHADAATVERAKQAAPLGYLAKPVRAAELRNVVEVSLHKHELECRLREREQWFLATLRSIADSVIAIDVDGRVTFMNPAAELLAGVTAATAIGGPLLEPIGPLALCTSEDGTPVAAEDVPALRALRGETVRGVELLVRSAVLPEGRWYSINASPVLDADGTIRGAVIASRDVTELRQVREKLVRDAVRDDLTGLLNRRGFHDQAATAVLVANRTSRPLALVCVDLNGMKSINDMLGHAAGDRALVATADLLRETFRTSDLLSRSGGDEFVVLASEYLDDEDGKVLRRRFHANLAALRGGGQHPFRLSASIGIAIYDPRQGHRTIEDLLADADQRMYTAKARRQIDGSQRIERIK